MKIKHDYPYDPTFGYTQEDLLKVMNPEPPEDFERFWRELHEKVLSAPLDYEVEREIWSPEPHTKILLVRYRTYDGLSLRMWIARPEHSAGGMVIGQGYGNMSMPCTTKDHSVTYALPNLRGLGFSQCATIPWDTAKHSLHGIEHKETYVITGAIADLWTATSVLTDLFPDTASRLGYRGGSLGGGMGPLVTAWDSRFHAAEINVPNFGGAISYTCALNPGDPGEQRRQFVLAHPESDTMTYIDASAAARFLRIPVLITPALFDPSNPPPGQFAVANAIPEKYRILKIREVGHFPATDKDKELENELNTIRHELFGEIF